MPKGHYLRKPRTKGLAARTMASMPTTPADEQAVVGSAIQVLKAQRERIDAAIRAVEDVNNERA